MENHDDLVSWKHLRANVWKQTCDSTFIAEPSLTATWQWICEVTKTYSNIANLQKSEWTHSGYESLSHVEVSFSDHFAIDQTVIINSGLRWIKCVWNVSCKCSNRKLVQNFTRPLSKRVSYQPWALVQVSSHKSKCFFQTYIVVCRHSQQQSREIY